MKHRIKLYTKNDIKALFKCSERTFFYIKKTMNIEGRYPRNGIKTRLYYTPWDLEKFLDYFYPKKQEKGGEKK